MAIISKEYLLKQHFIGFPKEDDFCIQEKELPPLADEEYLMETLYLSLDPYMRPYSQRMMKPGDRMIGEGVGRVILSKNKEHPVGTFVVGPCGWTTHHIPRKEQVQMFRKIPEMDHLSYALGVLGMPGITAYFGLLDICDPKPGESVFVDAAAGAVGSLVGQIAKLTGCYVVGCAGSEEKLNFLKEIGFDAAFNYKTSNIDEEHRKLFPKGIDCFFDNVGGEMFDTTMTHMKRYGRISLCGGISQYNMRSDSLPKGPYVHNEAIPKELKIQGFLAPSFYGKAAVAINALRQWITEGKIKVREHVVEGFDNMPKGFLSLFDGENIGKMVVKVK